MATVDTPYFPGIQIIDSDAHWPADFDRLRLGVFTAQRGWVTPDLVVNARPLDAFLSFLDRS